ncbi:hypothetical protein CL617_02155 [archaeon]|nr:hypothetical protein [archaeon]|tara:strand:+ start:5700 stop:6056 length:357 start_codon:yes stop_codon:yes gene_type:complete
MIGFNYKIEEGKNIEDEVFRIYHLLKPLLPYDKDDLNDKFIEYEIEGTGYLICGLGAEIDRLENIPEDRDVGVMDMHNSFPLLISYDINPNMDLEKQVVITSIDLDEKEIREEINNYK